MAGGNGVTCGAIDGLKLGFQLISGDLELEFDLLASNVLRCSVWLMGFVLSGSMGRSASGRAELPCGFTNIVAIATPSVSNLQSVQAYHQHI